MTGIEKLRHDIRGRFNAIKLCVSALPLCETDDEREEFLADIDGAVGKLVDLTRQLEREDPVNGPAEDGPHTKSTGSDQALK